MLNISIGVCMRQKTSCISGLENIADIVKVS